jgi:hypothetical protein
MDIRQAALLAEDTKTSLKQKVILSAEPAKFAVTPEMTNPWKPAAVTHRSYRASAAAAAGGMGPGRASANKNWRSRSGAACKK